MFILPFWVIGLVVLFAAETQVWSWATNPGTFETDESGLKWFVAIAALVFFPVTAVVLIAAALSARA